MGKLSTPFAYEDKLSGLAESFPLSLQDESRLSMGLSVCDNQPADSTPPVVGRFLRCTDQGGLLKHHSNDLENSETLETWWTALEQSIKLMLFAQTVYRVVLFIDLMSVGDVIHWVTPEYIILNEYTASGAYDMPFTGTLLHLKKRHTNGILLLRCYGFY